MCYAVFVTALCTARRRLIASSLRRCALIACAIALTSCTPATYVPELATKPYPSQQHTTTTADIQCFRRGTDIEIVNSTAHSYADFDLWINQRYTRKMDSLPAGATRRVSLWEFVDQHGRRFYAGGLFRSYPAEPMRLVQIQTGEGQPLIGLIAIRSEPVVTLERQ